MKGYMLYNVESSDAVSDELLCINNCGRYIECPLGFGINRPMGRKDYQLLCVLSGSMYINGKIYGQNTVYLMHPDEKQSYETAEENTSYCWVHFSGTLSNKLTDITCTINEELTKSAERFCKRAVIADERNREIFLLGWFSLLLGELLQCTENIKSRRTEPAAKIIRLRYKEGIKNEYLAERCGLSLYHFIRLFKTEYGCTPQQYRIQLLMGYASDFLIGSKMSVEQISEQLGFSDNSYFCRLFKKNIGCSPSAFRNRG